MKILVINAGSSSLKFQLIDMSDETILAKGICEKIGFEEGIISYENYKGCKENFLGSFKSHEEAFIFLKDLILDKKYGVINDLSEVTAVGHRVVQGGADFNEPTLVDEKLIAAVKELIPIAPLHNGANLHGILACQAVFGKDFPQVAVFDTAFHSTLPPKAYIYPLPYEFYEKYGVRKYGYHGISNHYVISECAKLLKKDIKNTKIITCHLGNGASITAVNGGKSVDTTMGFTPTDGFIMGTRSGSLDPGVMTFISEKENLSTKDFNEIINKKSGLLGVSGVSNDAREILAAANRGNKRAILAQEILCYQIMKIIASYIAVLGGCDAIVFTGGIGENRLEHRKTICNSLSFMGVKIDEELNKTAINGEKSEISAKDSSIKIFVIPTNEEIVIARETYFKIKTLKLNK